MGWRAEGIGGGVDLDLLRTAYHNVYILYGEEMKNLLAIQQQATTKRQTTLPKI